MMWVLEGSIIYRLIKRLFYFYENSGTKKFLAGFAAGFRNSYTAKIFRAFGRCKTYYRHSLVSRTTDIIRRCFSSLFKRLDRIVLRLSESLDKWSGGSILCGLFGFVAKASCEKLFPLAAPVFGIGYIAGRLFFSKVRIRDVLFLILTFLAAVVLMYDHEKLRTYFKKSLIYRLYLLVMG